VRSGTALEALEPETLGMLSPTRGDVILRGSIGGAFLVLDAITKHRVAGPLPLQEAVGFARQLGARNIFQQPVDGRGRFLADPLHLERPSSG
jgi:hypothetical protein